ncbi:hypothetical protein FRC09_000877 [Ceratobasidium sp. 395]|nr:hypothetical protein FRC09_000877 [Ceratobasidium sp. 395]
MAATANFVAYEVIFVAYINCSLTGDIDMVASAPSLVSLSIGSDSSVMKRFETELYHKATHSTYIAPAVAKLLVAFGLDIFNQFLPNVPTDGKTKFSIFDTTFVISQDLKSFDFNRGTQSALGVIHQRIGLIYQFVNSSIDVFQNFASVFWSAVLLDLGVTTGVNILTDIELFRQVIRSNIPVDQDFSYDWITGPAADFVLSNVTRFGLPLNSTQSTWFNARYLCPQIKWKAPASLAVDVLVATTSLFMVFWQVLHLALRYVASRSSEHANHCTCPRCEGHSSGGSSGAFQTKELPFSYLEHRYAPVAQQG